MNLGASGRLSDGRWYRAVVLREGVPVLPPTGPDRDVALNQHGANSLQLADKYWNLAVGELASAILWHKTRRLIRPLGGPGGPVRRREQWWRALALELIEKSWRYLGIRSERLPGEDHARRALSHAVDALNYLEDQTRAPSAHACVDQLGQLVSGLYGCVLESREGAILDTCPTSLAHRRSGLSPGFTATWACTVCGLDFSQCEHLPGTVEEVRVVHEDGRCNVCGTGSCTRHRPGSIETVPVGRVATHAEMHEVSFVARPRDPLARFTALEIPVHELRALEREHFIQRIDADRFRCLRCMASCAGFIPHEPDALGIGGAMVV